MIIEAEPTRVSVIFDLRPPSSLHSTLGVDENSVREVVNSENRRDKVYCAFEISPLALGKLAKSNFGRTPKFIAESFLTNLHLGRVVVRMCVIFCLTRVSHKVLEAGTVRCRKGHGHKIC